MSAKQHQRGHGDEHQTSDGMIDLAASRAERAADHAHFAMRNAESAADRADTRARDADRISRWTVVIAVSITLAVFSAIAALIYQVADLSESVDTLESLEDAILNLIEIHQQ